MVAGGGWRWLVLVVLVVAGDAGIGGYNKMIAVVSSEGYLYPTYTY